MHKEKSVDTVLITFVNYVMTTFTFQHYHVVLKDYKWLTLYYSLKIFSIIMYKCFIFAQPRLKCEGNVSSYKISNSSVNRPCMCISAWCTIFKHMVKLVNFMNYALYPKLWLSTMLYKNRYTSIKVLGYKSYQL